MQRTSLVPLKELPKNFYSDGASGEMPPGAKHDNPVSRRVQHLCDGMRAKTSHAHARIKRPMRVLIGAPCAARQRLRYIFLRFNVGCLEDEYTDAYSHAIRPGSPDDRWYNTDAKRAGRTRGQASGAGATGAARCGATADASASLGSAAPAVDRYAWQVFLQCQRRRAESGADVYR